MRIEFVIKNYRCFPDARPAHFVLQDGFTALLGVNNAGKSALLKFLYEFRGLFRRLIQTQELVEALKGSTRTWDFPETISDNEELFCNQNRRDIEVRVRVAAPEQPPGDPPIPRELVLTVPRASNTWRVGLVGPDGPVPVKDPVLDTAANGDEVKHFLVSNNSRSADLTPYIQAFAQLTNTLYLGAFRNAINIGAKSSYFDIDIGQAFIKYWRDLKTGVARRQNEAAYRLTEDIRAIFDFKTLEINPTPDDQTLQLFIDGRSYRLGELGSGLAQFILVLTNAAARRPAYILIDEPELNLHPTLQTDFLTTLASYASCGIVFATHSYGLARATGDRIYCLRRDQGGLSTIAPIEATPRLPEFLGELGFFAYRELGFGKVLLVEGATEVRTIQQFLRKVGKDHQMVLLPLGGSQMITQDREAELLEIKRICEDVGALIDSERAAAGAALAPPRAAFAESCKRVGIQCHVLDRRATENYFTDQAVRRVKGPKYRALGEHEDLRTLPLRWAKSENWKIAREMTVDDLKGTDLGRFLDSL